VADRVANGRQLIAHHRAWQCRSAPDQARVAFDHRAEQEYKRILHIGQRAEDYFSSLPPGTAQGILLGYAGQTLPRHVYRDASSIDSQPAPSHAATLQSVFDRVVEAFLAHSIVELIQGADPHFAVFPQQTLEAGPPSVIRSGLPAPEDLKKVPGLESLGDSHTEGLGFIALVGVNDTVLARSLRAAYIGYAFPEPDLNQLSGCRYRDGELARVNVDLLDMNEAAIIAKPALQ
jgi:hypothetical protein